VFLSANVAPQCVAPEAGMGQHERSTSGDEGRNRNALGQLISEIAYDLASRRYLKPALLCFRRVDTKCPQCFRIEHMPTGSLIPNKQPDLFVGLLLH
jgi:hypothetical protein